MHLCALPFSFDFWVLISFVLAIILQLWVCLSVQELSAFQWESLWARQGGWWGSLALLHF